MHDITPDAVVIGVDTHKDVHVAVAINGRRPRGSAPRRSQQQPMASASSPTGLRHWAPSASSGSRAPDPTGPA